MKFRNRFTEWDAWNSFLSVCVTWKDRVLHYAILHTGKEASGDKRHLSARTIQKQLLLQFKFNCFTIIQNTPSKSKPKPTRTFAALFKMLEPNTCRESFRFSHYPCSPDRVCVSASLSASMMQQRNFYTALTKLKNNYQITFAID